MSSGNNRYDVVVAGAGPAGSTAACGIAMGGFKVLLLEEHAQIGVPLHCSGLVSPRTLDEAGMDESLVVNRLAGAHIHSPSGRMLTLGDGRQRALVIDRVGFDRALVTRAQERGAELVTGAKLVGAQQEQGGVAVSVQRDGATTTVHTCLLVGADGAHSRVARVMGMGGPEERVFSLGAEGTLHGSDATHAQVFVGNQLAPGWFAWTIPLGEGRVRLGVGSDHGVKPVECLRRVFQAYAQQLRGWEPGRWTGGVIPLWTGRKVVQDNVMLVGDAAGQVKPTSGGGIYPSLVGARLAAETARAALAGDDLTEQALSEYPRAWEGVFGREFRQGRDLRRVYKSMTDGDFDRVLRVFGNKRLLRLINDHGDIDFPGGLFQRLTGLAPALWFFVRGPLRYAALWK